MLVIPKQCYSCKLKMKHLLKNIPTDLLVLRGNSSKIVELPDIKKFPNRTLNEEVSWSFKAPIKPIIHIESVLVGNPQPFGSDKIRYDIPKNWISITKKIKNETVDKPKQLTYMNILFS